MLSPEEAVKWRAILRKRAPILTSSLDCVPILEINESQECSSDRAREMSVIMTLVVAAPFAAGAWKELTAATPDSDRETAKS